ncbi:PaaI family thioesterase [Rhodovulum sp. DZ06]|uniref:PaaI family thioesterase n=1 Tax=Rhodovulum sp. DZ06 TaxID=3425126 RepID=UPI003D331DA4
MSDQKPGFGPAEMSKLLEDAFAPWVQALGLVPVALTETGATFRLPGTEAIARKGGDGPAVVCGQALAAAADTAAVLTLCGLNGRFRNCTTVDLTVHFMRPLMGGEDVEVSVEALSNGRRMATVRVEFRAAGSAKCAAAATCAFAYLEN